MITYNCVYNPKARETIDRMKKVALDVYNTDLRIRKEEQEERFPTIYYGVSDFNLSKTEQAKLFEPIIANTIIYEDNYNVLNDYDLIIMKNPTRIMLWKDAKFEDGTKYLYVRNKDEWRINYAYGKVNSVFNKNIGKEIFGKSSITQWTPEDREEIRIILKEYIKSIAEIVEEQSNLKSFGVDIIYNKDTNEYLFLELNQANSLSEKGCEFFLKSYNDYLMKTIKCNHIDELLSSFTKDEIEYLKSKLR